MPNEGTRNDGIRRPTPATAGPGYDHRQEEGSDGRSRKQLSTINQAEAAGEDYFIVDRDPGLTLGSASAMNGGRNMTTHNSFVQYQNIFVAYSSTPGFQDTGRGQAGGELLGAPLTIKSRRSPDGRSSTEKFQAFLKPKSKSPKKEAKSQSSRYPALLRTTKKAPTTERNPDNKFTPSGPRPLTAQLRLPSPTRHKTKKKSTATKKPKPSAPAIIPQYFDIKSKVVRNYYTANSTISTKEATPKPRPTSPTKKGTSKKLLLSET